MLNLFGGNLIGKRVMAVMKQRIADAQKAYDDFCNKVEEDFENDVAKLETEKETKKESHLQKHIDEILG